jgi:hypothetical protein
MRLTRHLVFRAGISLGRGKMVALLSGRWRNPEFSCLKYAATSWQAITT